MPARSPRSIRNTIWGLNTSYRTQFRWLTNLINKVPYINATAPSQLTVNAEFAQIKPGHPQELEKQGVSYLDDFEATKTGYSLREFYPWTLASTPYDNSASALFPEATKSNDINYGKNRALLAWYQIDGIFTRTSSSLMPSHIKADKTQRENHFVREVTEQEIFPNRSTTYGESSVLPVLNLAYYPKERGPYNLDVDGMSTDGTLLNDPAVPNPYPHVQMRMGVHNHILETDPFTGLWAYLRSCQDKWYAKEAEAYLLLLRCLLQRLDWEGAVGLTTSALESLSFNAEMDNKLCGLFEEIGDPFGAINRRA